MAQPLEGYKVLPLPGEPYKSDDHLVRSMPGPFVVEGLTYSDAPGVYPFREDSILLFKELLLRFKGKNGFFLDMGCGPGLNGLAAAREGWEVLMVDREPKALALARRNLDANGLHAELALSSLMEGVNARWKGRIDLAAFNPPYLEPFGELSVREELALSGGRSPVSLSRRFLSSVAPFIRTDGRVVLLAPKTWTEPDLIAGTGLSLESRVAREVTSSGERFDIITFARSDPPKMNKSL